MPRYGIPGEIDPKKQPVPIHPHSSGTTGGPIAFKDLSFAETTVDPDRTPLYADKDPDATPQTAVDSYQFTPETGDTGLDIGMGRPPTSHDGFCIMDDASGHTVALLPPSLAADHNQTLAAADGTIALLEASQSWAGQQTFAEPGFLIGAQTYTQESGASSTITSPDFGGSPAITGISNDYLGQFADLATVNNQLRSGLYLFNYYIVCSSGGVGVGAVTLNIGWSDGYGNGTATAGPVSLATTGGFATGQQVMLLDGTASDVRYSVTHTGSFLGRTYDLLVRVTRLS